MKKKIVVSLLLVTFFLLGLYRFTGFRRVVWYVRYSAIEPDKDDLPKGLVVPMHSCLLSYKSTKVGGWRAYIYDPFHNVIISVNAYEKKADNAFDLIASSFSKTEYVQMNVDFQNEQLVLTLDSAMRFRHLLRKADSVLIVVEPYFANIKPNDAYDAAMEVYVRQK